MEIERTKITVVTPMDRICPYCNKAVVPGAFDSEYLISGHGKFRRKQYFHKGCLNKEISNGRKLGESKSEGT